MRRCDWRPSGSLKPVRTWKPRSGARGARPPTVPSQITGEIEARLIALACTQPPRRGHARWSLRLLEKHVALVDDIPYLDHSTIGRILKERNFVLT